jgi:cysteine desulfurase
MLQLPVYLDYNATTPCDPRVVEMMLPYFTQHFGNAASRNHSFGWRAEEAVEYAREQVARLIGAEPKEIIFTSGATEADNLAIKGVVEMYAGKGNHIITSTIEHKAVLDTCKHLEKKGVEVTYLEVNNKGLIDPSAVEAAIKPNTILIALMYANNEIGTIMPVKAIGEIAKKKNIIFFSDATQATGKIPVDVNKDGIDLLAFSAHMVLKEPVHYMCAEKIQELN